MKKPFELNDKVFDLSLGWGVVTSTTKPINWQGSKTPFTFNYEVTFESGEKNSYDINGHEMVMAGQTLFFDDPKQNESIEEFVPLYFKLEKTKKNGYDYYEIWGYRSFGKETIKQKTFLESYDLEYLKFAIELLKSCIRTETEFNNSES